VAGANQTTIGNSDDRDTETPMRRTKMSEEIDLHSRRFVRAAALSVAAGQLIGMTKAQPPSAAHGSDVDEQGKGTVTQQRLYQLIRQTRPITDRQFEIELLNPDVEAFAFKFG
jgi:Thioredoxin like C-terminal domain